MNKSALNIFIIGSGNVAFHMAKAVENLPHKIVGVFSRNKVSGLKISPYHISEISNIPTDADIYLLCISDDAIAQIAETLPEYIRQNKIVAHTSGSRPIDDLSRSCAFAGIFYPLQTFSIGQPLEYRNIPFCISATDELTGNKLSAMAYSISESVHQIDDKQRKQIHASAVIINNFVNHLIYKSESLLENQKIDKSILQPLLIETINKQASIGAYDAQTGPARRGDKKTIKDHINLLEKDIDQKIYKAISKGIINTYKK